MTTTKENDVIEQAIGAVELYATIAHLLMDIAETVDNVSVGGATDYELKLMCMNKLKEIVNKIEI
jgi:hypothetical protein